jgi:intracellular multiplication protein IcmC
MTGGGINIAVLIQNLGIMGNIFQTIAVLMGLGLFMGSIFKLKRYGEMRTMMSHQMTIAAPLMMMLGGIMLLCLPFVLHTALLNFWASNNPMRYVPSGSPWEQIIPAIVIFVRLIGVGAFMRGIVLFSRAGGEHGQQGMMAKAVLHMLGGLLCVNIVATVHLLKAIIGWTTLN